MRSVARWLRFGGIGLGLCAALAGAAIWAGAWRSEAPPPSPAAVAAAVEVPLRPVVSTSPAAARRVVVTVRWGHPTGVHTQRAQLPMQWDGYLSLDCGDIERVDPLGLEDGTDGDRVGPVVRGEGGDQRVYWRSRTDDDDDGVKVQLVACRAPAADATDATHPTSSLRVVTPQRTYVARLDWSIDDFVSMKVGADGASLDVHISAQRDARTVRGARVTKAAEPQAPVSEGPSSDASSGVKPL